MNGRTGSWWGWLLFLFVMVAVFGAGDRFPVLPLIIAAILLSKVFQKRSGVSRPASRRPVGHQGPSWHGHPTPRQGPASQPPQGGQMPTIDVPRYPGDGAAGGLPPTPYGGLAGPPPPPSFGVPTPPSFGAPTPTPPPPLSSGVPTPPPPLSSGVPTPPPSFGVPTPPPSSGPASGLAPGAGAPHTSSDPVVSLGQLHLSRCGRDLQRVAQQGTAAEVERVLDEVADLSRRMQDMLGAADGTPGSGRREFQAGLRALDRLVDDARGEHPPGAKLVRVTQVCLRMGQTGRHE